MADKKKGPASGAPAAVNLSAFKAKNPPIVYIKQEQLDEKIGAIETKLNEKIAGAIRVMFENMGTIVGKV